MNVDKKASDYDNFDRGALIEEILRLDSMILDIESIFKIAWDWSEHRESFYDILKEGGYRD